MHTTAHAPFLFLEAVLRVYAVTMLMWLPFSCIFYSGNHTRRISPGSRHVIVRDSDYSKCSLLLLHNTVFRLYALTFFCISLTASIFLQHLLRTYVHVTSVCLAVRDERQDSHYFKYKVTLASDLVLCISCIFHVHLYVNMYAS